MLDGERGDPDVVRGDAPPARFEVGDDLPIDVRGDSIALNDTVVYGVRYLLYFEAGLVEEGRGLSGRLVVTQASSTGEDPHDPLPGYP
jgi:hypothetical protein